MNGLWKETVSGWNHKDSKRKRQTRKHTLRDKGRAILNTYDSFGSGSKKENANIFREEGIVEVVSVYENKSPIYESNVRKYSVSYPEVDKNDKRLIDIIEYTSTLGDGSVEHHKYEKERKVYTSFTGYYDFSERCYKDEYSAKKISCLENLSKTQNRYIKVAEIYSTARVVKLDVSCYIKAETHTSDKSFYNTREFLYNKPLYKHTRWSFYNDGARRKFGQKWANRMSRNNCKQWIRNGDFDKEIKSHPYEKSIAWLIH